MKNIDSKNLVFLDEMGVLLGLSRTHARAAPGIRAYDYKLRNAVTGKHLNSIQVNLSPFHHSSKVSVIAAITESQVLAVMTLNDSMDAAAFRVYVNKYLVPQLWEGAVVVMDNLPAHKVQDISPLIEAVGATILYLSPYSPQRAGPHVFNPIEHWWSQLKAFLRKFSPKTSAKVDLLIKIAIDLINPAHLRNWFIHCCYYPS